MGSLGSCAGTASSDSPSGSQPARVPGTVHTDYNDADLDFAESMPPHHDQAIEMSRILLHTSGVSPEV